MSTSTRKFFISKVSTLETRYENIEIQYNNLYLEDNIKKYKEFL